MKRERITPSSGTDGEACPVTAKKSIFQRPSVRVLLAVLAALLLAVIVLSRLDVFKVKGNGVASIVYTYGKWCDRELETVSEKAVDGDGLKVSVATVEDKSTGERFNTVTIKMYGVQVNLDKDAVYSSSEYLWQAKFATDDNRSFSAFAVADSNLGSATLRDFNYKFMCSWPGGEDALLEIIKVEYYDNTIIISAKLPEDMEIFQKIVGAAYETSLEFDRLSCIRAYNVSGELFVISESSPTQLQVATNTDISVNDDVEKKGDSSFDATCLELIGLSLQEIEAKYGKGTYIEDDFCYDFGGKLRCGFSENMRCMTVKAPMKTLVPGMSSSGMTMAEFKEIFGSAELGYDDMLNEWWCLSTVYKNAYLSALNAQSDGTVYPDTWFLYNINNWVNEAGEQRCNEITGYGVKAPASAQTTQSDSGIGGRWHYEDDMISEELEVTVIDSKTISCYMCCKQQTSPWRGAVATDVIFTLNSSGQYEAFGFQDGFFNTFNGTITFSGSTAVVDLECTSYGELANFVLGLEHTLQHSGI